MREFNNRPVGRSALTRFPDTCCLEKLADLSGRHEGDPCVVNQC